MDPPPGIARSLRTGAQHPSTGRQTRAVAYFALVAVAVVVVVITALWALQRFLIYLPSTATPPPAGEVIQGARDVTLKTGDGLDLGAWLVPARNPTTGFTVLVANGNAGDRSFRAPLAEGLAREGLAVLLFDYRGYGGNPGTPSEKGLALDARAAVRFLVEDEGVASKRLVYFGESLGAAVATELATEHPPAGLVLRSPFTDLASVGAVHYPFLPVGALLRDRYPLIDHIQRVEVPTTVVYGTHDEIVPADQSQAVARAAGGPTTVVELQGALHNDVVLSSGPEVVEAVVDLVERLSAER